MTGTYCSLAVLGLLLLTGCEQPEARAAERAGSATSAVVAETASRVDSALSREEEMRRFLVGLPPVDSLSGGVMDRDTLVMLFTRALERGDTAQLAALALTKSEFAYLYYPTAREALPPYDLSPSLVWFLTYGRSNQGIRRALQRYGGQALGVTDYACAEQPEVQGANRVWGHCTVRRLTAHGDTIREALFAQILERGGRFKFLSYANRFN